MITNMPVEISLLNELSVNLRFRMLENIYFKGIVSVVFFLPKSGYIKSLQLMLLHIMSILPPSRFDL